MTDIEKTLGVPTGLQYGLIALGFLIGIAFFIYEVFYPMLKSIISYL